MHDGRLKKWEIALACAVGVTLVWGLVLGQTPCFGWWGAVYPELAAGDGVQETLAGDGAAGERRPRAAAEEAAAETESPPIRQRYIRSMPAKGQVLQISNTS